MKGEQHRVVVTALANSGDGVGRIGEKVVFIPYTCPGDEVVIEITENKKSFAKGRVVEILSLSAERVEPPCNVFGQCGGCDWQHIHYHTQLHWKKSNLVRTLQNIGGVHDLSLVADVVPSPSPYHYRNRIQLHHDDRGFYFLGKQSHRPVRIQECWIASAAINNAIHSPPLWLSAKTEVAEVSGSVQFFPVNDHSQSELGFRQVNDHQNRFLIEKTLSLIEKSQVRLVYDLYCGQGNWTFAIQERFPEVQCIGIESDANNVAKAKAKAATNTQFIHGKSEKLYPASGADVDLVIVDPPRAGCDPELLHRLQKNPGKNLIYISCHPATLARDIKILCEQGFRLAEVVPIDMFPQTAHLEVWCLLRSAT